MDWQLKPMARQCAASKETFEVGERIHCLLLATGIQNELARADIREAALESFQPAGQIVGRWTREIRSDHDEAREARKMAAQSAEMLFFSLYENAGGESERETPDGAPGTAADHPRDTLRHLLALLLERKRILRAVGRRSRSGTQTYLHIREKREFIVPLVELDLAAISRIQSLIGEIVGPGPAGDAG